tara:strand:+ start:464 stop:646 length:183 start_codon:yes stop_codon:yes gene_type:complete
MELDAFSVGKAGSKVTRVRIVVDGDNEVIVHLVFPYYVNQVTSIVETGINVNQKINDLSR